MMASPAAACTPYSSLPQLPVPQQIAELFSRCLTTWRVAVTFERFAHCSKCGNFDLEHISRERVESGTLLSFKRWLHFPAYRCDPCRERFFSVRLFRRIRPSMVSSTLERPAES